MVESVHKHGSVMFWDLKDDGTGVMMQVAPHTIIKAPQSQCRSAESLMTYMFALVSFLLFSVQAVTQTRTDPVQDTFGKGSIQVDIIEVTVKPSLEALVFTIRFAEPVTPPSEGSLTGSAASSKWTPGRVAPSPERGQKFLWRGRETKLIIPTSPSAASSNTACNAPFLGTNTRV